MSKEIVFDTAQDDVCVELWEILQAAKSRALAELDKDELNKLTADDAIYLASRAGTSYRYHAEHPRIALVPTHFDS